MTRKITLLVLTLEKIIVAAQQIEPKMIRRFTTHPAKLPLEALLLFVQHVTGQLQSVDVPILVYKHLVKVARFLAHAYPFSPA